MKKIHSFLSLVILVSLVSCTTSQRIAEVNPSQQDTHRIWVQNNTPPPNHPTGRKIQNNINSGIKAKWYIPQQSTNANITPMVHPQFRYQSNYGFGISGTGAFQRGY
jgi:hypothetical protein